MKYDAVIFDMDGVLVDSEVLNIEIIEKYFESKGVTVERNVMFTLVGASGDVFWGTLRDQSGIGLETEMMRREILDFSKSMNVPYQKYLLPGVIHLLEHLRTNGYKLALASSTERERVMRVLSRSETEFFFTTIMTGDMFKESKPNPEIYLRTAEKLRVDPKLCLAIEDSAIGIEAAVKAGMTVVARKEERFGFDQSHAHYIVDNLTEVMDLLSS